MQHVSGPRWTVECVRVCDGRVTYRLVDTAGSGVSVVGVACSRLIGDDLLRLADGAVEFDIEADEASNGAVRITVAWLDREAVSHAWSAVLPEASSEDEEGLTRRSGPA